MKSLSLVYVVIVILATLLGAQLYRTIWRRRPGLAPVPTGFGVFLAPAMLGAAYLAGKSVATMMSLGVITIATAIYWFDDVTHLSARVRLLVAFLAGVGVALCWFGADPGLSPAVLVTLCVVAGIVCIILTQMANFQDGADLNLGTFVALTAIFILAYTAPRHDWAAIALAALGFIVPFCAINARPRTLYLGDSGSFAFAGLMTILAVAFAESFSNMPPEAAIPSALPVLDVAYVFLVRLREKHDLLTRNYLHLYQRLDRRYVRFAYLLPQVVNAALCLAIATVLQQIGLGRILSVVLAITATVPFYFACRALFLAGPPEGPLHETVR